MEYGQAQTPTTQYPSGGLIQPGGQPAANAPTAPTLVSALASLDELNKRLDQLRNNATEIAQAVGGPFPVGGDKNPQPVEPSAMQRLNGGLRAAHATVSDMESALHAVRRSLGG